MGFSTAVLGGTAVAAFAQQRLALHDVTEYVSLDPLYHFKQQDFRHAVKTRFTFGSGSGRAVAAELIEVIDMNREDGERAALFNEECFAVLFAGPRARPLRQGSYQVTHDLLGSFTLFISPTGKSGEVSHYQAVINRSR